MYLYNQNITKIQGHKIVRCDMANLVTSSYLGLFFSVLTRNSWTSMPVESVYSWLESTHRKKNNRQVRERNCFEVRFKKVIALCGNESRVGMLLGVATKMATHHSSKNSSYSARINVKKYRVPFPSMHAQPPGDCYHNFPLWKTVEAAVTSFLLQVKGGF